MQRARERADDRDGGRGPRHGVGTAGMAHARVPRIARLDLKKLGEAVPAVGVIAALIAAWWLVVVHTESAIFPTPLQVLAGARELVQDGTLWEHIGASLMRVGTGFAMAVLLAVPLGLWMGWMRGAYITLNPLFQMLRP